MWIKLRQGKKPSASYLSVSQGGRLFLSCQQINPPENIWLFILRLSPCCLNFTLASLHFLCLLACFYAPSLTAFGKDLTSLHGGLIPSCGVKGWSLDNVAVSRCRSDKVETDIHWATMLLHIIQGFCFICLAFWNKSTQVLLRSRGMAQNWRAHRWFNHAELPNFGVRFGGAKKDFATYTAVGYKTHNVSFCSCIIMLNNIWN